MFRRSLCLTACVLATFAAFAQTPVKVSSIATPAPKTQVAVLGTAHLAQAPKGFKPESLKPLLDKLAAFKPQIITVEQVSGETCDLMARHTAVYDPDDVSTYCHDTSKAKAATGLDVVAALAEVKKVLKAWPANPTAAQRRHLAALFLASGDDVSAWVQWQQLPKAQRHAGDGLDDALVDGLNKASEHPNESIQVAAQLAVRLGLQRVYPVDDHTGDNADITDVDGFRNAVRAAWASSAASLNPLSEKEQAYFTRNDMLGLYRFLNQPDVLQTRANGDFGAAMSDPSPQHFGQIYVAGWEARNLRMVSNVRVSFRETPGVRVLALVGAGHKLWFDSLLGQMQGVDVVDIEKVLN